MKKSSKLIISLILPQMAGWIGALFTASRIPTWYAEIAQPPLAPPNWVFGPVWTLLFVLMGVALYIIWSKEKHFWQPAQKKLRKIAMSAFGVQLVLNTTWSLLFFGLRSPGLALIEIFVLWGAIFTNLILFYKLNKTAGLLLVPYLVWVSFAVYLNYAIWILN